MCKVRDSRGDPRGEVKSFSKLFVLEFDSTRKRMSVVVRYPCGRVFLVTKGRPGLGRGGILPVRSLGVGEEKTPARGASPLTVRRQRRRRRRKRRRRGAAAVGGSLDDQLPKRKPGPVGGRGAARRGRVALHELAA